MLISCVAYQNGRKRCDISVDQISDSMKRPNSFVWVVLKDPQSDELKGMQREFDLHDLAISNASNAQRRPKVEEYGDALLVLMHSIDLSDGAVSVGQITVFVGEHYVLVVIKGDGQDVGRAQALCEHEPHQLKQGPSFALYAVMDAVVDRYFPLIDVLESELESIEEQMFCKGSQQPTLESLYQLKRKAIALKHAVAPLAEAVGKLSGARAPAMFANTTAYFRDVYNHLTHINTSIDFMHETIDTAIQVSLAMVGINENEVSKRLAAWAAIFAVATIFVGIWGMNFTYMPELKWVVGYPAALGVIAVVCGYLYSRFRKAGWL